MENYYVTNSPHCFVYTSFYPFENFLFWKLKCQGMQIRLQQEHAHGCWTLDFFVSDIKLQAIYKVIHTSNYDGHISKYVCKIGKYNQSGIIFPCNKILVHMK